MPATAHTPMPVEAGDEPEIARVRRQVLERSRQATEAARSGVLVWRGQRDGEGALRSVLPTTAYGTPQAASTYAESCNDRSLEPAIPAPFAMPAVLEPTSVFCLNAADDHDPFIDLETVVACLGRDLAEHLARTCAATIRETSAFEDLKHETGIDDPLEMVRAWPRGIGYLPPVLMHEALREEAFVEALRRRGHDAVLTGGCGMNAMEPEWHVLDPAIARHGFDAMRDHLHPCLSVSVNVFEDVRPGAGTARADVSPEMLDWFRQAAAGFEKVLLPEPNTEIPRGALRAVEVWLCSRDTAETIFDCDGALGFHQVTTPDSDPFEDEAGSVRAYRVFVVCDKAELDEHMEEARDYGVQEMLRSAEDQAVTLFHELAHVALFAANANFNTPADIETLSDSGEINNDLFDMSSGYGIRPLIVEDEETWAEDADHARQLMEAWCEERGREWLASHSPGVETFLAAAGIAIEGPDDELDAEP